jgi:hypothetical protein
MSTVQDPLKMRAMGFKKPIDEKQEKIQNYENNLQRYYPINRQGGIDEWGAVIRQQADAHKQAEEDKKKTYRAGQQDYSKELENQMNYKNNQAAMDAHSRSLERDAILRNAEIKRQIDNQIADSYN